LSRALCGRRSALLAGSASEPLVFLEAPRFAFFAFFDLSATAPDRVCPPNGSQWQCPVRGRGCRGCRGCRSAIGPRPALRRGVLAQTSRADLRDHHVEGRRRFGGVKRSSSGHGVRRTALEVSGSLTWFSLSRSTVSITGNPAVAGWRADHELRMTRLPHTRRGLVHRTRPVATSVTIWRRSRVGAANLGEALMPTDTRASPGRPSVACVGGRPMMKWPTWAIASS
jgi:hypothetical protein